MSDLNALLVEHEEATLKLRKFKTNQGKHPLLLRKSLEYWFRQSKILSGLWEDYRSIQNKIEKFNVVTKAKDYEINFGLVREINEKIQKEIRCIVDSSSVTGSGWKICTEAEYYAAGLGVEGLGEGKLQELHECRLRISELENYIEDQKYELLEKEGEIEKRVQTAERKYQDLGLYVEEKKRVIHELSLAADDDDRLRSEADNTIKILRRQLENKKDCKKDCQAGEIEELARTIEVQQKELHRKNEDYECVVRELEEARLQLRSAEEIHEISGSQVGQITQLINDLNETFTEGSIELLWDYPLRVGSLGKGVKMTTYRELAGVLRQCVPSFSGTETALEFSRFKDLCEQVYENEDEAGKLIFIKCIRTRFVGEAYGLIANSNFNTWDQLRQILDARYMKKRSFESMTDELRSCEQRVGEGIQAFGARIEDLQNACIAAVKTKYQGERADGVIGELKEKAERAFKRGLLNQGVRLHLVSKPAATIRDLVQSALAIEDEVCAFGQGGQGNAYYNSGQNWQQGVPRREEVGSQYSNSNWVPAEGSKVVNRGTHVPRNPTGQYAEVGPQYSNRAPTGEKGGGAYVQVDTGRPAMNMNRGDVKCFSCGSKGHMARNCRQSQNQNYCVTCRTYGHLSSNCVQQQSVRLMEYQWVPGTSGDNVQVPILANCGPPGGLSGQTTMAVGFYCRFCKESTHETSNCLKRYLAENAERAGNGIQQTSGTMASAYQN